MIFLLNYICTLIFAPKVLLQSKVGHFTYCVHGVKMLSLKKILRFSKILCFRLPIILHNSTTLSNDHNKCNLNLLCVSIDSLSMRVELGLLTVHTGKLFKFCTKQKYILLFIFLFISVF